MAAYAILDSLERIKALIRYHRRNGERNELARRRREFRRILRLYNMKYHPGFKAYSFLGGRFSPEVLHDWSAKQSDFRSDD